MYLQIITLMANLIFAHTRFIVSATWTSLKALSVYLVANFHFSQSPPNDGTLIDLSEHQVFSVSLWHSLVLASVKGHHAWRELAEQL